MSKLAQRNMISGSHRIDVGLTGDIGYISISDQGFYPPDDSRHERKKLGFNTIMIPLMTRRDLKNLKTAIEEVLKNSK